MEDNNNGQKRPLILVWILVVIILLLVLLILIHYWMCHKKCSCKKTKEVDINNPEVINPVPTTNGSVLTRYGAGGCGCD